MSIIINNSNSNSNYSLLISYDDILVTLYFFYLNCYLINICLFLNRLNNTITDVNLYFIIYVYSCLLNYNNLYFLKIKMLKN
jgi:hypothetical protein